MTPRALQLALALLPLSAAAQDADARAAYELGHRLATEGRHAEAVAELRKVPAQDSLHPYAARALLYCAWQCGNRAAIVDTAQALIQSPDSGVAALAAAALAEYQLCIMGNADAPAMETLRQKAAGCPDIMPTLAWLEAEQLRLRGEQDAAAAACRQIETDPASPTVARHRARLILADIYYAKEAEAQREGESYTANQAPKPPATANGDDEDEDTPEEETLQTLEGKGEETLLTFITANPDSPLLEEAFRRLKAHQAFDTSEYARAALNEWVADTTEHKRRAALALSVLQHLLNRDNALDAPVDTSCAATAATALPDEPATAGILLDQMRSLYLRGRVDEARALLASLPETFPSAETAAAAKVWQLLLNGPQGDWGALLEQEKTSDELRGIIRHNAFVSTLAAGNTPEQSDPQLCLLTAQHILSEPHAGKERLQQAQTALQRVLDTPQADAETMLHARILACDILARSNPRQAIEELTALKERTGALPPRLVTDFHRALERAHYAAMPEAEAVESMIAALQGVYPLRMHLASLMVLSRNHREEATRLLKKIVAENPRGDNEAQALLLLAECTAQGNTPAALQEAMAIYERAAAHAVPATAQQARIRRAALLVRTGKCSDAEQEMRTLLSQGEPAPKEEAMARVVLSNALALGKTDEQRRESMACLEEMMDGNISRLPRLWQFMLLQTHTTRCMRLGEHARAMRSVNTMLQMHPAQDATTPQDPEWIVLYHASACGVQALLELEQYAQAADMAERAATCNPAAAPKEFPQSFTEWAAYIRQEHVSSLQQGGDK
ncbi:MAG: hypothetical protein Q4C88_00570 [Akkermansia sp.]|nr:hypothetical protein [Akkermansia sp.]